MSSLSTYKPGDRVEITLTCGSKYKGEILLSENNYLFESYRVLIGSRDVSVRAKNIKFLNREDRLAQLLDEDEI